MCGDSLSGSVRAQAQAPLRSRTKIIAHYAKLLVTTVAIQE